MSRSLTRPQALVLALVVIAGISLGGWGLYHIGDRQRFWSESAELRAAFASAHGIDSGTPVRVRGVEAGQVTAVDLPLADNPQGKVVVRLKIDKRFLPLLCADANVRVLSEGLLGGRVLNIEPGEDREHPLASGSEIAVVEGQDLTDVIQETGKALRELRDSNGTLPKLLKDDTVHKELVSTIKQGQETFQQMQDAAKSLKQDADALKRMPLIRGYVEDANALLFRPDCDRDRRIFASRDLFEPERSVLSEQGKQHLHNLRPWLEALRVKGSEAVIVSYCAPSTPAELAPAIAQALCQKQSEAVLAFMREQLGIHKVGWFTTRKVTALGMGVAPPPVPDKEPVPGERTEIQIFLPR